MLCFCFRFLLDVVGDGGERGGGEEEGWRRKRPRRRRYGVGRRGTDRDGGES